MKINVKYDGLQIYCKRLGTFSEFSQFICYNSLSYSFQNLHICHFRRKIIFLFGGQIYHSTPVLSYRPWTYPQRLPLICNKLFRFCIPFAFPTILVSHFDVFMQLLYLIYYEFKKINISTFSYRGKLIFCILGNTELFYNLLLQLISYILLWSFQNSRNQLFIRNYRKLIEIPTKKSGVAYSIFRSGVIFTHMLIF